MSMEKLMKQRKHQWIAIVVVGFMLVVESQARVNVESEQEMKLIRQMKQLSDRMDDVAMIMVEQQHRMDTIQPSSFHIPVQPKHQNHKHGPHDQPLPGWNTVN